MEQSPQIRSKRTNHVYVDFLWRRAVGSDCFEPPPANTHKLLKPITCTWLLAWAAVLFLLPRLILLWANESRHTRIQRYRHMGYSWQQIADRYHCSANTAKRWPAT
ncbi:hypothetical protein [Prochlorococcus marinus]|uniref:hypothetical protein n=1 Tax=Prochlorococcus TaxID=1218 RepID=UPI0007B3E62E|nr:hypothetical protein [Prochlorococcus marinus]